MCVFSSSVSELAWESFNAVRPQRFSSFYFLFSQGTKLYEHWGFKTEKAVICGRQTWGSEADLCLWVLFVKLVSGLETISFSLTHTHIHFRITSWFSSVYLCVTSIHQMSVAVLMHDSQRLHGQSRSYICANHRYADNVCFLHFYLTLNVVPALWFRSASVQAQETLG